MINPNAIRFWWNGNGGAVEDGSPQRLITDILSFNDRARYSFASNRPQFNIPPGQSKAFLTTGKERVNLFQRSEEFDNAYWTKSNVTISTNQIIAPDGTLTADKMVEDATLNQHRIFTAIDGTTKNVSIYAKAAERSYIGLFAAVGTRTYFNLSAGTIGTVSSGSTATIESVGNGWYRCSLYNAHPSNGGLFQLSTDGTTDTYTGDGTSGIYIWGAQLEEGSYATPYIKTTNSAVTIPASNAIIPNAIPATGTILLWDKHDYEPSGQIELLNFNGDGYLAYEEDGIEVNIGGGSFIAVSDKEWQPNGVLKPWFYALTYNATTVTVYRGDREGNLHLALPATAHGGSPSVEDLVLNSPARDSVHLNSDILTTDEQLTEAQITAIYNGSLPIFQTRAYKGDNFDRVRQKVANEVNGTFDQEGVSEARSVAFFDLYSVYHPTAKAYFEYVESEGGVITDRSSLNDDITNFLTQELS